MKLLIVLITRLLVLIKSLKSKLVYIIFKNSVRTSKRTRQFTFTEINWLMVFKETIPFRSEDHKKPIHKKMQRIDY
jgi:hypothetical protein